MAVKEKNNNQKKKQSDHKKSPKLTWGY